MRTTHFYQLAIVGWSVHDQAAKLEQRGDGIPGITHARALNSLMRSRAVYDFLLLKRALSKSIFSACESGYCCQHLNPRIHLTRT